MCGVEFLTHKHSHLICLSFQYSRKDCLGFQILSFIYFIFHRFWEGIVLRESTGTVPTINDKPSLVILSLHYCKRLWVKERDTMYLCFWIWNPSFNFPPPVSVCVVEEGGGGENKQKLASLRHSWYCNFSPLTDFFFDHVWMRLHRPHGQLHLDTTNWCQ